MGNDADVLAFGFEDRPLFDVQFEHGVHLVLAGTDFLVAHPADALQFIAERFSFGIFTVVGPVLGVDTCKDAGGKHRRCVACTFLVGPVGNDDRVPRLYSQIIHGAHQFETAEDAEHAVIFAAGRLGVEMRADINGKGVRIGSGTGHEHVAHCVDRHGHASFLAPFLEQLAAFRVLVREGLAVVAAGNTRTDLGHLHETVPQTVRIDPQVLARSCHLKSPISIPFRRRT